MPESAREGPDLRIVLLRWSDEIPSGHADPVLCPFKLRLQGQEVLVGLEIGIAFDHHHQAAERTGELLLGLLELGHPGGIFDHIRRDLHRTDPGPRLYHRREGFPLLRRIALDGRHQIRDQIGASLVLVFHLAPGRLDLFIVSRNVVDAAASQKREYR